MKCVQQQRKKKNPALERTVTEPTHINLLATNLDIAGAAVVSEQPSVFFLMIIVAISACVTFIMTLNNIRQENNYFTAPKSENVI
jgi:hypothetical protein